MKKEKRSYHITDGPYYCRYTASSKEEALALYLKYNKKILYPNYFDIDTY